MNLIRRARPVFLQCVHAKSEAGRFDVPGLRVQLQSTQILSALQFHRTGQHGWGHAFTRLWWVRPAVVMW